MDSRCAEVVNQRSEVVPAPGLGSARRVLRPRVDILENSETFEISLEMPGVNENDLDVRYEKGTLAVSGQRKDKVLSGMHLCHQEASAGVYQRQFHLGESIDVNRIEASMKDGVVRLVLPKSEGVKARKIVVKGN